MARATTTAVTSFRQSTGTSFGVKHQGVDEPVEDAAHDHGDGAPEHGAPAHDGLPDDEAGQTDDHDAGTAVDVS